MNIVDLAEKTIAVTVKSSGPIECVSLGSLVTLATVLDLTNRPLFNEISRRDVASIGVSGISGCILRTLWSDGSLADAPVLTLDAAAYLLEGGVRTVAADFPIVGASADLLLQNKCVLVYCLSNTGDISKDIVRLIALPLKTDASSAEARVIAIEE